MSIFTSDLRRKLFAKALDVVLRKKAVNIMIQGYEFQQEIVINASLLSHVDNMSVYARYFLGALIYSRDCQTNRCH